MLRLFLGMSLVCTILVLVSLNLWQSKQKAEGDLRVAQASILSLQESYDKQAKTCLIADNVSTELQEENRAKEKDKQELLDKIDRLPSKSSKGTEESQSGNVKNEEIDIDALLPESIRMLTEQAFNSTKGKANADAR